MNRFSRWLPLMLAFVAGGSLHALAFAIGSGDALRSATYSALLVFGVGAAAWLTARAP